MGGSFRIENLTRALRPRRRFLRGVVTKLGNLGRSNQMDFAKAVFDVEFSTARQQPGVVVVVNVHLRPIRDMHREGAEWLCAEAVEDFVDPHERDASRWELAAQGGSPFVLVAKLGLRHASWSGKLCFAAGEG